MTIKHWPLNLIAGCFLLVVGGIVYCDQFASQRKGTIEIVELVLMSSAAFMAGSFFVTVLLCHYTARLRRRPTWMTLFWWATFASAVLTMISGCLAVAGSEIFAIDFWGRSARVVGLVWLLGFLASALVAFGVVTYYKRNAKRDTIRGA